MKGDILVIAEHKQTELDNITWELLTQGRAVADQWGTRLAVLLVGSELDALVEMLENAGVDLVLSARDPLLNAYHAEMHTTAIAEAVRTFNPSLVLMGYTYLGMETGPAVAARLGGTLVTNCTRLDVDQDKPEVVRSLFGGTLHACVRIEGPAPHFVSFEKGVLPRETLAQRPAQVQAVDLDFDGKALRSRILDVLTMNSGGIDITKAKILVSAGRGLGSPDKIQLLRDLADALGAELACSRPVADMGWLPFEHQVGISAATVSPDVYIACGISGASQHVTAMRDSGTIIAINKDPKAPIFRVAHYGIAGDLFEVIPAMIKEAAVSNRG